MAAEKHINYFALQKACEKPGCPVCTIVTERAAKYIDNMLFEHVSDRGFRSRYRDSDGFCPVHAKNLESFRDGLAVAILGADILSNILPGIKKRKVTRKKGRCPACEETERIERDFLGFVAESSEAEFTAFFTVSEGLCVPHYRLMIACVKKIPSWLSSFQEAKFDRLLARTKDFIEFSAWGRQTDFAKLSAADKVVWKELALVMRGNKL